MTGVAAAVAIALLLGVALLYVPFGWRPVGLYLFAPKVLAVAFVGVVAALGAALALLGLGLGSWWVAAPAALACVLAAVVVLRVGAVHVELSRALGPGWERRIPARRWRTIAGGWWWGRLPRVPEPRVLRDVTFGTVPETGRELLCDVWRPAIGARQSGLAIVYLHGSGYYLLDKDVGTRRLFRHLTGQGHVVVDVAYRLYPETDVPGMVRDARRAVAWTSDHADALGIERERIVLAGASAGGHLALLEAYGHGEPAFTPPELAGHPARVCGVVSLYGQVDLAAMYEHTRQARVTHADDPRPDWNAAPPPWMRRVFGADARRLRLQFGSSGGRCDWLLGGTPEAAPAAYAQVSALRLVRGDVPPTLLVHGLHDEMAPVAATRELERRLVAAGAPVAAVYLPHTDHMLDFALAWSPAARQALHVLEEFLAALAIREEAGRERRSALACAA